MKNKYVLLAIFSIIIAICLIFIIVNTNNNKPNGTLSISSEENNFDYLDSINITFVLHNNETKQIKIDDFSLAYNIELQIYDEDGKLIKSLFTTETPTSEIDIPADDSYNKTIDINLHSEQFYYLNTDTETLGDMFLFEPGTYTIIANYYDRTMPEESATPIFVSNELNITIN